MEIKVAFIGPYDLVEEVIDVAISFPTITLLPFGYKDVEETIRLVGQCKSEVDVLLFAGPIPYQLAREEVEEGKPMIYLPHNGTSLYRVFFQLLREDRYKDDRLRFSIDILRKEDIEGRLEELDIRIEKMYVKEFQIGQKTDDMMQFHYQLWMNQQVDAVLTCMNSVYKQLVQLGVPCYRIIPTKTAIQECLQRAELEGKSVHLSDKQLAIVIISVDSFAQKSGTSEYELQRKKLAVQQILIDYCEETQALMNWSDRDEITFVTTRGVIERTTLNFSHYPLLDQIVNQLNLTASIGIGLGRTANEAEIKAREALQKARVGGGRSCYIVMQDGDVLGLLGNERVIGYSVRSDDPQRLQFARKTGLSVGTVNRLISYCQGHGSSKVTAAELATGFGITIRSARRILSRLEQSDLANIVGEEQPVSRGRPRQLYQLNASLFTY
ncbi:transcriptional regulator [Brevibacillus choshinensis]|uniref:transcriptional regulator n=1 Tax=Brevibacillus choshinensis TaxID=54911 RepID=UPI002E1C1183|nr:transcriptional regulator [Brevibacillus choshinensis]